MNFAKGNRNVIDGSANRVKGNSNYVVNSLKDLRIFARERH